MKALFTSRKTWLALLIVALLGGVAWWQRQPALAWYQVRQLASADEENCEECAIRVAELEEAALPHLLSHMQGNDAVVCANMQRALVLMTSKWGSADPRTQQLLGRMQRQFEDFSLAGQEKIVLLTTGLLQRDVRRPLPVSVTKVVSELMVGADRKQELRPATLMLAAELIEGVQPGQWVDVCRGMAERGLKDERPGARIAAVELLRREPMRKEKETMQKAIPLLRDVEPAVRRAALVTLASETEVVREEAFLPLLHDDDAQVQFLAELALRKRGLHDDELAMARMISDKNPATRMRVVYYFAKLPELNLSEWLRQLSQDPEPAVRAAALQAMADNPHIDVTARLREMAQGDPSDAVRENARYYLQLRLPRAALD